jgi:hypothetical protein
MRGIFRESLREVLEFGRPEEICHFEWGYWPETLQRWRQEGLPEGLEPWDAVGITYYHRVPVRTRFCPEFEVEVIEETKDWVIRQNEDGVIERCFKDHTSMPEFIRYPVESLDDFERIKERLDPDNPERFPSHWDQVVGGLKDRDSILVLGHVEISFFGWHRDLMGLENLCIALVEQPELIHAISRHHVDFLKRLYAKIIPDVEFDFVFMWEDMCYKNGPLISPAIL